MTSGIARTAGVQILLEVLTDIQNLEQDRQCIGAKIVTILSRSVPTLKKALIPHE
jgi:hypothetical protein